MHILFISWWWPYPANNGSKIRIYNLLRNLAAHHKVTLLAFAEAEEATTAQIEHLQTFCAHVESVPKPHIQPGAFRTAKGYLSRWSRYLEDVYSETMEKRVSEIARYAPPDVVIASQLQTMRYLELVPEIPTILEEMEITGFHERIEAAGGATGRFRAKLTLTKLENVVRTMLNRGVVLTVVSGAEQAYFQQIAPSDACVELIPNGVDTITNRPDSAVKPRPYSLIYTGAITYSANLDAVSYFIREVLPLVRARVPEAQLTVTGAIGDVDISDLASQPGVTFSGYLASVADAVRESWMLVAPLRFGGGTRLKILEAMALGTPVISTHKGAEGLAVEGDIHLLFADDSTEMADAICRLFDDEKLRDRLASAGRTLVESQYDWSMIGQQLLRVIDQVTHSYTTT